MAHQKGKVAFGFDDGVVVVQMGREEPAVSMDGSGKLIWARHNDIISAIIKGGGEVSLWPAIHRLVVLTSSQIHRSRTIRPYI